MNYLRAGLLSVACGALAVIALRVIVGTSVTWSILLALPVAALLLLFLLSPHSVDPTWQPPPVPPSAPVHLEASVLATRLADASTDQNRFRTRIQPRLARAALARLRHLPGLDDLADLRDPRAATALGPELHRLLTHPQAALPNPKTLATLLDRLEKL